MRTHYELALLFFNAGDFLNCAGEFEKLAAAYPDSATFVYNLAVCHDYLGNKARANAFYARAAALLREP